MKISYTGIEKELPPKLQEKLDAKFAKISKVLEKRGEKEAHVVLSTERYLHNAEITIPFYGHKLAGAGSDADLFTAISTALDKLETQALKLAKKSQGKSRRTDHEESGGEESALPEGSRNPRVFRVNHPDDRKPMTVEEAVLEISADGRNYLVYLDADKASLSVLVRRPDGNFDLIES